MKDYRTDIPGFVVRQTPADIVVVELDYFADPDKSTPEWLAKARKAYPNERDFRREFLRDWTASSGENFYPEYHQFGGDKRYVIPSAGLLQDVPIERGWDFGFRNPACVWLQVAPQDKRVWVLRSIMAENIDTYSFRDLVLYLSGQLPIEALGPRALTWVQKIREDNRMPNPPWFGATGATPLRFRDWAGPEANHITPTVDAETKERTDAQVLESAGVYLQIMAGPVRARENVMRRLMQVRADGWPGIVIDPSNVILLNGLRGGIAYPKGTATNPQPQEPVKDGYYEHIHDALGYALVGTVPVAEGPQPRRIEVWSDRRPQVVDLEEDGMGWLEAVKGRR